tara:strand:+ start:99 stop:1271 length:1173 start_codon:yes stop_codon:yes gene_type:complete
MKFIKIKYYLKIFFINLIILYGLFYLIELFINFNNNKLFNKTRLYYLNNLKDKNPNKEIYLNYSPYKLLDKKNKLLPLSGYENSKILLCLDEKNNPVYFNSDDNGFNNETYNKNDLLLIGDSYVQGMCVNNKDNLNSQFRKFSYNTSNLAVSGNGPLIQLATFKEYKNLYDYEKIIIFFTPDNDFFDLNKERKNSELLNYLNLQDFNQSLYLKENREIKKDILNSFFGKKTQRIFNDILSVYHFNLKSLSNKIENMFKINETKNNFDYLLNNELDILLKKILLEFKSYTKKEKKELFIVFNSVNPEILFPKSEEDKKLKNIILKDKLDEIKKFLDLNSISYYDFNEYVLKNFSDKNISSIFKKIDGRWDHYTEKGFFEMAEQIHINLLKK